jgi:hypothetical protein
MRMTWMSHRDVLRVLGEAGATLLAYDSVGDGLAPGRRYYISPA